jgi:hypothetical protein
MITAGQFAIDLRRINDRDDPEWHAAKQRN